MKKIKFLKRFILITTVFMSFAKAEIYSSFSKDRQERFACQISSQINDYVHKNNESFKSLTDRIEFDLKNNISIWASVLGFNQLVIGSSKLLFSDYDYFLQNAFINVGDIDIERLPKENWFGAYAFLSAKTEVQYRLGEINKYDLSLKKDLLEQISDYLKATEDLKWPSYLDDSGNEKYAIFNCRPSRKYGEICNSADTNPPGDPDHISFPVWIKAAQAANLVSSPLFLWILSQPNYSITYESLFERAVKEYKNPIVALGVITWMMMVDSHMGDRNRGAVLSKRIQPIIDDPDLPGHNYHFWGYLLKTLYGEGFKYRVMSFVHERIIQGDKADWIVDKMAITFGNSVLKKINNPKLCVQIMEDLKK